MTETFLITGLTVFILACFVGYYVVWRVTPALHSPLMAVTNAISSVVIVGAIIAAEAFPAAVPDDSNCNEMRCLSFVSSYNPFQDSSHFLGFIAIIFASINIFGGFIVSRRMLAMFKKKDKA